VYVLWKEARQNVGKPSRLLAAITMCAIPLSLYATTGYAVYIGDQAFSRSPNRLLGFVTLSFIMFFALIFICAKLRSVKE
jgi:hypothetical protein